MFCGPNLSLEIKVVSCRQAGQFKVFNISNGVIGSQLSVHFTFRNSYVHGLIMQFLFENEIDLFYFYLYSLYIKNVYIRLVLIVKAFQGGFFFSNKFGKSIILLFIMQFRQILSTIQKKKGIHIAQLERIPYLRPKNTGPILLHIPWRIAVEGPLYKIRQYQQIN